MSCHGGATRGQVSNVWRRVMPASVKCHSKRHIDTLDTDEAPRGGSERSISRNNNKNSNNNKTEVVCLKRRQRAASHVNMFDSNKERRCHCQCHVNTLD